MDAFLSQYAPSHVDGLIVGDAKQLAILAKISHFDNVVQVATFLGHSLRRPNGVVLTPGGVLAIPDASAARAIYKVPNPDVLFIGTLPQLAEL